MPQVTVYIRSGDVEKWKTVDRKAEFIHTALNNMAVASSGRLIEGELPLDVRKAIKAINEQGTFKALKNPLDARREETPDTLGLACCRAKKPCKHWHFDDVQAVWVNELTRERRETA